MTSVRPGTASSLPHRIAVTATARVFVSAMVLLLASSAAQAAITAVSEPPIPAPFGAGTVDPFTAPTGGNVGLADVRMLRQTFKNPATFDVGQIVLAFDVGTGVGGINMSIFEVADVTGGGDVNSGNWALTMPAATPLKTLQYFGTLPGTTQRLGFNLSGSDIFTLPARFEGTTGYGIEFTVIDQFSNPGQFRHSNTNALDTQPDLYLDGKYFIQSGGSTNGNRDFGVWFASADPNIPAPGDVDGLNGVNLDDLTIIAANFRVTGPKTRAQGDLTGDGVVDIFDFRDWKANYPLANSGGGSFEALLGIPEPTSCLLLLIGGAGVGCCRRRR